MLKVTSATVGRSCRVIAIVLAPWLASTSALAADPGKQACLSDAKRLCAPEMQSLSRSKVRACLITHIEQTSPGCHDFMIKARAQALAGHVQNNSTGASTQ